MFRTAIVALFAFVLLPLTATQAAQTDVRVLIDVSGSMLKNDPRNLRVPALRLFVNIIPNDARAAIWAFSTDVSELAPLEVVNRFWRDRALANAAGIHSQGQRTDIESALARATANPGEETSILLLTDGMVDVSQNEGANQKSRERIRRLLPVLRASGITINTVALSDRADHALLEELSVATGGWYERTDSAEQLQRLFFRMFERSSTLDTIPITGNRFQVDKAVAELTMVVFRSETARPTRVLTPSGDAITHERRSDMQVRWTAEAGYDLVTIAEPIPGEWTIDAPEDPDNRVLVVTDLKLQTNDIPNYLWPDETTVLRAALTNDNARITDQQFLNLVRIQADVTSESGQRWGFPMVDDGVAPDQTANDGEHAVALTPQLRPGRHEVTIRVESDTFAREARRTISIMNPLNVRLVPGAQEGLYELRVGADQRYVNIDRLQIDAWFETPDNRSSIELSKRSATDWSAVLEPPAGSAGTVSVSVAGTTRQDQAFERGFGPFDAPGPSASADASEVTAPATEAVVAGPPVKRRKKEIDWFFTISVIASLNLAFVLLGFMLWRHRRNESDFEAMLASEGL